ncbi:FtsX-like permease family protein [Candidatus Woesearchaeota archaeon]|nr:FtsX-like permease family protein [Candidatus Woesearchaeota archaeon]
MATSVISSLFLFKEVSQFLIVGLQEKVDVSVYFKEMVLEDDILELKAEIAEIPEVKEIKYISKDEAFEEFNLKYKDNPVLMQALEEVGINPFLASLNIKAFEADQYQAVVDFLASPQFEEIIEKVDYYERKTVIERIFSLTSSFNVFGIIFSLIFAIVAVLVVYNTVRLAIYNCKEEIKVQRLVGASNWFIRGPFLTQGIIAGFFTALISLALVALLSWIVSPKIEFLFTGLSVFTFFTDNFWTMVLISSVSGVGLGVIPSLIAVRKYLKV